VHVDLLFSDVVMPGRDAQRRSGAAREGNGCRSWRCCSRQGTPKRDRARRPARSGCALISKPYRRDALARKVPLDVPLADLRDASVPDALANRSRCAWLIVEDDAIPAKRRSELLELLDAESWRWITRKAALDLIRAAVIRMSCSRTSACPACRVSIWRAR